MNEQRTMELQFSLAMNYLEFYKIISSIMNYYDDLDLAELQVSSTVF